MELARNLKVESVARLHLPPPLCLTPEEPVSQAVLRMRQQGVGCVLLCRRGRLVGIFTERDLLRRVLAVGGEDIPLAACMTLSPVTVSPLEPIAAAVRRMVEGGYRHLPVVDPAGRPLGVLSVKSVIHYLVQHFPATIYNLPPDPRAFPRQAEGA